MYVSTFPPSSSLEEPQQGPRRGTALRWATQLGGPDTGNFVKVAARLPWRGSRPCAVHAGLASWLPC